MRAKEMAHGELTLFLYLDDVIRFCLFPAQKKTEKKRKLDLSFWHIYQQFTER